MNIRERWESGAPLAHVLFDGQRGLEEASVYDMNITGCDMLALAIGRHRRLSRIILPISHLIYLQDDDRRIKEIADVHVFLEGGIALPAVLSSMHKHTLCDAWQLAAASPRGVGLVRTLIPQWALREIVPMSDESDDVR